MTGLGMVRDAILYEMLLIWGGRYEGAKAMVWRQTCFMFVAYFLSELLEAVLEKTGCHPKVWLYGLDQVPNHGLSYPWIINFGNGSICKLNNIHFSFHLSTYVRRWWEAGGHSNTDRRTVLLACMHQNSHRFCCVELQHQLLLLCFVARENWVKGKNQNLGAACLSSNNLFSSSGPEVAHRETADSFFTCFVSLFRAA